MPRLAFVVGALVAFAGCQKPNPDFCPSGPNSNGTDCIDGGTGGPCKTRNDCTSTPGFPVCDTADSGGTCVQCTIDDHTLCTGLTPHCEDRACVGCIDDSDCGDPGVGVCLPTGGCADPSSIIHAVSTGGSIAPDCGTASNACTLDTALTVARPSRNVIKLDDAGPYTSGTNYVVDTDATIDLMIDARGAVLHRNSIGSAILTINSGKGVTLLGGTIEGATGSSGDGILCNSNATLAAHGTIITMNEGTGINAPGGCTLTLSRSRIVANRDGGVIVTNSKFVIVGNMFLDNGDPDSPNAAVTISTATDATNLLEFNTIANNATTAGIVTAGVDCKAGAGFTASHNIIWNNAIGGNANTAAQIANNCMHVYSDIGPMAVTGTGNSNDDPFLSSDGHLGPGSPALQKVELGTDLSGLASRDIDGDPRVAPADIGADQVPRP
jgi:hypothetical protein